MGMHISPIGLILSFRKRFDRLLGLILIFVGIACILTGCWQTYDANRSRVVNLKMEDIGKLSTQVAHYTNVQVLTNSRVLFGVTIPFTQSKYIYSYDGVIEAGIDFSQITYTIDSNNKVITIFLPEAGITGNTVDEKSLVVYDETRNIFTPLTLEDVQASLIQMKEEAEQQAIANGILQEATVNAKTLITAFLLHNSELEDHQIVWQPITKEE